MMPTEPTITPGPNLHPHPVVSVVVPTYASAYLDQTLATIRAQTFPDWELIVVDDGSPEPQVPAVGDDLVLVRQLNGGPGAARNAGARVARGELLAFCDSDDRWRPEKLQRQVELHRRRPELVLSTTDVSCQTDDGEEQKRLSYRYRYRSETIPLEDIVRENCIATSAAMLPRAAFEQAGGFAEDREEAEDYALWLRLAMLGPVAYLDELLVEHIEHTASLTAQWETGGHYQRMERNTYEAFFAAFPAVAAMPCAREALARNEFEAGRSRLRRGEFTEARAELWQALRQRPLHWRTWTSLARACLHLRPNDRSG